MKMDQAVLVTGCSSGIGYCVAHGLKKRGYRVFATARKTEDIERLEKEGLESLYMDYTNVQSIDIAVSIILERTNNQLYALFNNGAYGLPGAVEDLSRDALTAQFDANFFGWHQLTCRLIPVMRAQGFGRIIQNSSVLGFAAMPYRGAYIASKFALEGLSDTLRLELYGTEIHISLIEPGPISSHFRENAYTMFLKYINQEQSFHRHAYELMIRRLQTAGPAAPFTLEPEAVLKKVIHALESKRPRPRYYVTVPTYFFGTMKRIFSTRQLDKILFRAGGSGKR